MHNSLQYLADPWRLITQRNAIMKQLELTFPKGHDQDFSSFKVSPGSISSSIPDLIDGIYTLTTLDDQTRRDLVEFVIRFYAEYRLERFRSIQDGSGLEFFSSSDEWQGYTISYR